MKINTFCLTTLIVAFQISSCGQSIQPSLVKKIAANFSKDKIPTDLSKYRQATFAAGCFWHEETLFESINGVVHVESGYAGGTTNNPTYEQVSTGETGHTETVNIYYDSSVISYPALLNIYFEAQSDPTQVNGQGPDNGTEYRSVAFYRNNLEKETIEKNIRLMNKSGKYKRPVATSVKPFKIFYKAEDYHQRYINTNTDNPYVMNFSIKEIARFQASHPELIKPGHNFATGK